jgi:hypothetical protein
MLLHGEGPEGRSPALSDLRLLLNQPPRKLGGSHFFFLDPHQLDILHPPQFVGHCSRPHGWLHVAVTCKRVIF